MAKAVRSTKEKPAKKSDRTGKSPKIAKGGKNKHRSVSKNTVTPMRAANRK